LKFADVGGGDYGSGRWLGAHPSREQGSRTTSDCLSSLSFLGDYDPVVHGAQVLHGLASQKLPRRVFHTVDDPFNAIDAGCPMRRHWHIGIEMRVGQNQFFRSEDHGVAVTAEKPVNCYRGGIARYKLFLSSLAVRRFPASFFVLFAIPLHTL